MTKNVIDTKVESPDNGETVVLTFTTEDGEKQSFALGWKDSISLGYAMQFSRNTHTGGLNNEEI